ncbi:MULTISPECIES: hypothetical protein [Xanthobacter]|uniref:hypothetical protein n=1 Tax=Xanthobacter TaxID=279 RepID=UPI0024A79EAA|nr:hypothetical protein [Xanthobacter autotrophicus]MDI4655855.1 hypothetical protein [Xanthobacter autotrophicus]MDI4665327.1 hypothetical protein [Xanthobacter autotrophicus]
MTAVVIFHKNVEEMTMTLEQHIEELRAELRNAVNAGERREIAAELETARAELARKIAEEELP